MRFQEDSGEGVEGGIILDLSWAVEGAQQNLEGGGWFIGAPTVLFLRGRERVGARLALQGFKKTVYPLYTENPENLWSWGLRKPLNTQTTVRPLGSGHEP